MRTRVVWGVVTAVLIVIVAGAAYAVFKREPAPVPKAPENVVVSYQVSSDATEAASAAATAASTVRSRVTSGAAKPSGTAPQKDGGSGPSGKKGSTPATGSKTPETRFGLTLEQRKSCYFELVQAEDRAVREAEAAYPLSADKADVDAHVKLRMSLLTQYRSAVGAKYGLNADQLNAVSDEGVAKAWPMPPLQ